MIYNAALSPPQLFVGTEFHEEIQALDEYGCVDYDNCEEEHWIQEPIEISKTKLIQGIESLGIKVINIEFGDYDMQNGLLWINSIECEYDGLVEPHREYYIETGITCFTPSSTNVCPAAFYFK